MKNTLIPILSMAVVFLCGGIAGAKDVTSFCYNDGSLDAFWWGSGLKETYDVAVRLDAPEFVGSEVIGIRVPVQPTDEVASYSAWLSSALQLDGKQNLPDIQCKEGERSEGTLEIMFDTPYVLTSEGVYVGYSFQVDSAKEMAGKNPLSVCSASIPGSFFIHSSRTYLKWIDIAESSEMASGLQVIIRGDFVANSVKAVSLGEVNGKAGEPGTASLILNNTGVNAVSSIGYTVRVGDLVEAGTLELEKPMPAQYGAVASVQIGMPAMPELGSYPVEFTVTEVNGVANKEAENSVASRYYALEYIPKHNPYMEEITGTWCSWCPIGFVALEMMNERHPDFIGVACHAGDIMTMRNNVPDPAVGYPTASLDRGAPCSPYYGNDLTYSTFGIEPLWESVAREFTPFDISMKADFTDDSRTAVRVDVNVKSVKELEDAEYRVEFILVQDGMTGTGAGWIQMNSYGGDESYRALEGMDFFVDQPYGVKGLSFNDVAILNTGNLGVEGSLPAKIECGGSYSASHIFELADAVNTIPSPMVQNVTHLRTVALVVKNDGSKFGKVMNAAKCFLDSLEGVEELPAEEEVAETLWYDMAGCRLASPVRGLCIKVERLADGRWRTSKIAL